MSSRSSLPSVALSSALALGLATVGQLSWIGSGTSRRNSYELLRSAQQLGLDDLTPLRVLWYLIPVLSMVVAILAWSGRERGSNLLLGLASTVVAVAGVVVLGSGLAAGPGAPVATAIGAIGLAVAGWRLVASRFSSHAGWRSIQLLSTTKDERSEHRAAPAPASNGTANAPATRRVATATIGRTAGGHDDLTVR